MPKYESSKFRNAKVLKQLNESREGTMLDFIDAFCERFPKNIDTLETLLTDNPYLETAYCRYRRCLS